MGKKKRIARYPQKFSRKYAGHPITRKAQSEQVVEAVAAEEPVVASVIEEPVVEAPAKDEKSPPRRRFSRPSTKK